MAASESLKNTLKKRILDCVKGKGYVYIDDIAIDLLIPKSSKETVFDKVYKELVFDGKLILIGNCVRENI